VPSGVLNPNVINVIGNGTVINLTKLITEEKTLNDAGVDTSNVFISDRAQLIFPYHQVIDALEEEMRKERNLGTTKRGIGPTYSDKASRRGLRVCDLNEPNFKAMLAEEVAFHNELITDIYHGEPVDFETIYAETMNNYEVVKEKIVDSGILIDRVIREGKKVLFEGAQGVLLDIDHGTYPFVTSSNTTANNVSIGTGIHNKLINKVVGVAKAYNTRVGTGAMPTEIDDEVAHGIRERGHEYGSNTGRPRRIG